MMGFIIALLVIGIIYFLFFKKGSDGKFFLKNRREIHKTVEREGGMYEMYQEFVDYFKDQDFQIKEVNNESLYLHYGTEVGKIGIQVIQTETDKAEILMGCEMRSGKSHQTTIKVNTHANQNSMINRLLESFSNGELTDLNSIGFDPQKNDQSKGSTESKSRSKNSEKSEIDSTESEHSKSIGQKIRENSDSWFEEVEKRHKDLIKSIEKNTQEAKENDHLNKMLDRTKRAYKSEDFGSETIVFLDSILPSNYPNKILVKFTQTDLKRAVQKEAYLKGYPNDFIQKVPSIKSYVEEYNTLKEKRKVHIGEPFPTVIKKNGDEFFFKIQTIESPMANEYQHNNLEKTALKNSEGKFLTKDGVLIFCENQVKIEDCINTIIEANGSISNPDDAIHYFEGGVWRGNKKLN